MISLPNAKGSKLRRVALVGTAMLAAIGMSLTVAAPAYATYPDMRITYIGSNTVVNVRTGYNDWHDGKDREIVVVAYLSNLTPTTVRLNSFKICFYGPNVVTLAPEVRNTSYSMHNLWPTRIMGNGTCITFYNGWTWTKQSNGEMFRVIARISDGSLYNRWNTISGFYR